MGSPRTHDESTAAVDRLEKLQAVTDAALAHLSLEDLLAELLTRIRDVLEADTCALLLLEEDTNELVARAAKGLEEEVERGVRIPVGAGFAGRIAAERRPVVIEDLNHAYVVNPILREKGIKSMLGVPVQAGDRFLGVLHVGTLTHRQFDDEDSELLQIVAQRAGAAIDHALAHQELLRLTELQRDFVALAAHELRAPASSVYGLASTLHERRSQLSADDLTELETVLWQQAERLRHLVEQLLDLSRLDTATIQIIRERVPLKPHLEHVVRSAASDRAEDVYVEVPDALEATVDPAAVDRIVGNLVLNALLYGAPPVIVHAEQTDRHLRISVEDRGSGVDEAFVPHLFDRFRRSDPMRSKAEGSGLGLAIARSYATAHGGDLFYTAASPHGARFELVLPNEVTS